MSSERVKPGTVRSRLRARPEKGPKPPVASGERPLGLGAERDGVLWIPSGYSPAHLAPVMLCLHGAGGMARHRTDVLRAYAERSGVVLVAPDSLGSTWDVLLGGPGPDVRRIDQALSGAFALLAIDEDRVAIEGFSDGASYALSLGLDNGDLFRYIFAFSPGFMRVTSPIGTPSVFVSHGVNDAVLPIACSRRIVPALRRAGYPTEYSEFEGGHVVPEAALRFSVDWLVSGEPTAPARSSGDGSPPAVGSGQI